MLSSSFLFGGKALRIRVSHCSSTWMSPSQILLQITDFSLEPDLLSKLNCLVSSSFLLHEKLIHNTCSVLPSYYSNAVLIILLPYNESQLYGNLPFAIFFSLFSGHQNQQTSWPWVKTPLSDQLCVSHLRRMKHGCDEHSVIARGRFHNQDSRIISDPF